MKEVNSKNEFENLLKEKADRFELKPSPAIWQQVESELPRSRSKWFFWGFALVFVTTVSVGSYFLMNENTQASKVSSINTGDEKANGNSKSLSNSIDLTTEATSDQNKTTDESKSSSKAAFQNGGVRSSSSLAKIEKSGNNSMNESVREKEQVLTLSTFPQAKGISLTKEKEKREEKSAVTKAVKPFVLPVAPMSSFYVETEASTVLSYVWNRNAENSSEPMLPTNNSYWMLKGYSAGANVIYQPRKTWFAGTGIHLSRTTQRICISESTVSVSDSSMGGYLDTLTIAFTQFDTTAVIAQYRDDVNHWLTFSAFVGVELFPQSKNHLRLKAGAGYSTLLTNEVTQTVVTEAAEDIQTGNTITNQSLNTSAPSYHKDQLDMFSEIAYVRDLSPHLSFSTGAQFHYYPRNLFDSQDYVQHMVWFGLNGSLIFRL